MIEQRNNVTSGGLVGGRIKGKIFLHFDPSVHSIKQMDKMHSRLFTCLTRTDIERLDAYLGGGDKVSSSRVQQWATHLIQCVRCQKRVQEKLIALSFKGPLREPLNIDPDKANMRKVRRVPPNYFD